MEDRLRDVEQDVVDLNSWRATKVDPWISSGKDFREVVGSFITTLKAQEQLKEKLDEERHNANTFKLNLLLVVATVGLLIVGIASYQSAKHSWLMFPRLHSSAPSETAHFAGGTGNAHF